MMQTHNNKPDLRNLSAAQLGRLVAEMGEKPFRVGQIQKWLYKRGVRDIAAMTDLSKGLRIRLGDKARLSWLEPRRTATSSDSTAKYLFELGDGSLVESVLIPEADHHTLCISSQVGCRQGCAFCRTATLGFTRNLTPAEIIGQVLHARSQVDELRPLTNLVFMGMGEPLDNLDNLLVALEHILGPHGLQMSQRKVTVSTAGLTGQLPRLGQATPAALAVSLGAADDELRSKLMPVNRRCNLDQLKAALAVYPLKPTRRITVEYTLLGGVNDQPVHARQLATWVRGLKVKINLIPFNPYEGSRYGAPAKADVQAFKRELTDRHLTAIIRGSRGQDIDAACGQLAARQGLDNLDSGR